MKLVLRSAQPEDAAFLYTVHKAAMETYVKAEWGIWDEKAQREEFHQSFRPELLHVITLDDNDIGVLALQDRAEELFIITIEILPAYQRRGIGTAIIQQVIDQARQQGKPVALQVLKVNIAARALYQRLGFGVTGENRTHYIMAHPAH